MYNVSNNFIQTIAKGGKEKDIYAVKEGTQNRIIPQSFKPSFDGDLFKSIMQRFDLEVKNGELIQDNLIFKYGLKVNDSFEYITYNTAIPYSSEINYDTNIVKTTLYDNMIKFMVEYNLKDLNITYPCTILRLVQAICSHVGVQLYSTDFYNKDFIIDSDLFTALNCTYRDILDYICQVSLTSAIIKDNKLYFKRPTQTNVTITPNMLKKLKIKEHFGKCNSLVLGRGDLNDNVYSLDQSLIDIYGLQEIRFDNNEIVNKVRENVIDGMFNQIKGLEYNAYDVSDLGIGIFEPLDIAKFQDLDGNNYETIVLNQTLVITSGCSGSSGANMPNTSTTKYQYASTSEKTQKRTEIIVDKQNQKIDAFVGETTERVERVEEQTKLNTDEIAKAGIAETVEGQTIDVDASRNPAILDVYGNTEQATRDGKNLYNVFDKKNFADGLTVDNDGWISVSYNNSSGTSTKFFNFMTDKSDKLKVNTNYSIFCEIKECTGTGSIRAVDVFTDTAKGQFSNQWNIPFSSSVIKTNKQTLKTLSDFSSSGTMLRSYVRFDAGQSGSVKFRVSVLEDTTILPTDFIYEPYGVSPSPDYPSRIRNVGDNINLYNPFEYNKTSQGVSFNAKADGSIEINGTATANATPIVSASSTPYQFLLKAGTYTLSGSDPADTARLQVITASASTLISGDGTFTINEDTNVFLRPIVYSGKTANIILYPKLEQSSLATPYTPYKCGSVDIKVVNKNLYNSPTVNTSTMNGITGTFTNSEVTLNGTATNGATMPANATGIDKYINLGIFKAGTYKLSFELLNGSIPTPKGTALYIRNSTGPVTSSYLYNMLDKTITLTEDTNLYAYFYIDSGTVFNNCTIGIQIEKNTIVTEYVPHEEQYIVFPLTEGELLHKGDYLEQDGIHQTRKTIVLDGSENWAKQSDYLFNVDNILPRHLTTTEIVGVKSSQYTGLKTKSTNALFLTEATNYSYACGLHTNGTSIRFKDARYTNINDFKTWLSQNPVTVEYELEEEIVIPYTPEQQQALYNVFTYKGITHIYCTDEIQPEKFVLTYYPNLKLNDTLVAKDTFDRVTSEMNAEFTIKTDNIASTVTSNTVAQVQTLLNNDYLTAEQVNAKVGENIGQIATLQKQVEQKVTSDEVSIKISQALSGGVEYLKNTLFTINQDGMTIATNKDEFNALYNNKGMYLKSYDNEIAKFDVDGTTVHGNFNLEGEMITPNLRMMNVNVSGVNHTHIHWIGG